MINALSDINTDTGHNTAMLTKL